MYGEYRDQSDLFTDIIQTSLISENNVGPKVFGLFPYGRLEELIDASNLSQNDYYDPEISRSIAKILADFHILKMPFSKEPKWLFRTIET